MRRQSDSSSDSGSDSSSDSSSDRTCNVPAFRMRRTHYAANIIPDLECIQKIEETYNLKLPYFDAKWYNIYYTWVLGLPATLCHTAKDKDTLLEQLLSSAEVPSQVAFIADNLTGRIQGHEMLNKLLKRLDLEMIDALLSHNKFKVLPTFMVEIVARAIDEEDKALLEVFARHPTRITNALVLRGYCYAGKIECVERLVKHYKYTVKNLFEALCSAIEGEKKSKRDKAPRLAIVKLLLATGADPTYNRYQIISALINRYLFRDIEFVRLLLSKPIQDLYSYQIFLDSAIAKKSPEVVYHIITTNPQFPLTVLDGSDIQSYAIVLAATSKSAVVKVLLNDSRTDASVSNNAAIRNAFLRLRTLIGENSYSPYWLEITIDFRTIVGLLLGRKEVIATLSKEDYVKYSTMLGG